MTQGVGSDKRFLPPPAKAPTGGFTRAVKTPLYAAYLREVVKERDFETFRPWRRGITEHEAAWKRRVLDAAAKIFGLATTDIVIDLDHALENRQKENRRRYVSRLPALLSHAVVKARRLFAKWVMLPALRLRYVGFIRDTGSLASALLPPRRRVAARPIASIVVLSYNRLDYLRTTFESLHATTGRDDYELVVVDNGSMDGSAEALRSLAERGVIDKLILLGENRGTSAGFNAGFAAADSASRYLIKLDSDIMLLTPGWLRRFEAFHRQTPNLGLLALKLLNHVGHRAAFTHTAAGEKVISWNVSVVGGACMTIPRAVFQRLGYFREDFGIKYMPDDVDYAARVALLGLRSYYLCGAVAYHRGDRNRRYSRLEKQKTAERAISKQRMSALRREYICGQHDLYIPYSGYDPNSFPGGRRILELR